MKKVVIDGETVGGIWGGEENEVQGLRWG